MSKKNRQNKQEQAINQQTAPEMTTETVGSAPITRTMETLIGIANRKNHSINVVLKKDSLVLPAAGKTGKDYKMTDIVSVHGLPLAKAVSSGMCAIIR